jgi:hypothetical protein
MFFFLHPLTIFILPAILIVYSIIDEDKRLKNHYGIEQKNFRITDGLWMEYSRSREEYDQKEGKREKS